MAIRDAVAEYERALQEARRQLNTFEPTEEVPNRMAATALFQAQGFKAQHDLLLALAEAVQRLEQAQGDA